MVRSEVVTAVVALDLGGSVDGSPVVEYGCLPSTSSETYLVAVDKAISSSLGGYVVNLSTNVFE